MWTLVRMRIATLQEIETHWSIDDLARATNFCDAWGAAEERAAARARAR